MKVLDLIFAAALKGGIAADNADLKNFLATPLTPETVIPESVAKAINSLHNQESALADPKIIGKIKADALDQADTNLLKFAQSLEDPETLEAVKGEKSSYSKIGILESRVKALLEKRKAAKADGDPDAVKGLNKELSEARELIKQIEQREKQAIEKLTVEHQQELLRRDTFGEFAKQPWSDLYSPDIRETLAQLKLNQKLSELGAKVVYKDGKPSIIRTETGQPYYDSAQNLITLDKLVPQIMSESKFLKVAQTPGKETIAGPVNTSVNTPDNPNARKSNPFHQQAKENLQTIQQQAKEVF